MRAAPKLGRAVWSALVEGPRWRPLAVLAALVIAAGGGAGAVFDGDRGRAVASAAAGDLPAPGEILRDDEGNPVLGKDGKPLRLGRDGRTIVDSKGRPVLGKGGKPLTVGRDGGLPRAVQELAERRRGGARRERSRRRRPGRRRGGGATPADRSPVVITVAYDEPESVNQTYAAYGASAGAAHGGRAAQATAEYLNSNGGIGGRPVEVRLHEVDLFGGRAYEALMAEACVAAREAGATAAIYPGGADPLGACLERAGIAYLDAGWPISIRSPYLRDHPGIVVTGGLPLDRGMAPWVGAMRSEGFFERGERIGLLRFGGDEADYVADQALKPALRAAGVSLDAEIAVRPPQSGTDIPQFVADAGSAALRMRAERITRVISFEGGGGELLGLFMRTAEAQGYRPRYGLTSASAPNSLVLNVPHEQLRGAVGIGWAPFVDTPTALDEDVPETRRLCSEILRNAGVQTGSRTPYGQQVAYGYCDALLLTYFALDGRGTSAAAVREGVAALGDRYTSPTSIATRFAPNRNWGPAGYRALRFNSGCGCFRYDGGALALD